MVAWPISTFLQKMKKIYQAVSEIGPHSNGTATRFRLRFWRFCDIMGDVTKTSCDVTKTPRDVTHTMTSLMTSQTLQGGSEGVSKNEMRDMESMKKIWARCKWNSAYSVWSCLDHLMTILLQIYLALFAEFAFWTKKKDIFSRMTMMRSQMLA